MLQATPISRCEKSTLYTRPVFVQDIMQPTLSELTAPCDVLLHGRGVSKLPLRLPAGAVISYEAGAQDGAVYTLMCDVYFIARGQEVRAERGMRLTVPAR